MLLARLKRLELIENVQEGPTPYVPNAWKLTSKGRELKKAISQEAQGVGEAGDPRVRPAGATRIPAETFHELFDDRDAVVLAAFEHALARAEQRGRSACEHREGWLERIRAGLIALLELFDEQPELARLLVVRSTEAGPVLQARRREVLAHLVRALDDERAPARRYPPPLVAEAIVSGVLGVLHERLSQRDPGALVDLSNSLMSFIVLPFLGARAARRELARPAVSSRAVAERKAAQELLHGFSGRAMRHPLAPRVLKIIATEPALSNIEVARRAGVADEGHMSRVLARLSRLGLIEHRHDPELAGAKHWHLTSSGEDLHRALRYGVSLTTEREASRDGAVLETATGFGRLLPGAARGGVRLREPRVIECRQASGPAGCIWSPTPPLRLPLGFRCAVGDSGIVASSLNKRWQACYSISVTDARSNRHRLADARGEMT